MRSLLPLALLTAAALARSPANDTTLFQTNAPWSPRVNVEAGTVMAYGLSDDLPASCHPLEPPPTRLQPQQPHQPSATLKRSHGRRP